MSLCITRARVVTCDGPDGSSPRERLAILEDAAVVIEGDRVAWIGSSADAPPADDEIDAEGRALLPGLVDPHTHLVFAGSRVDEFARKMAGEDYRRIAAEGGGIKASVRASRAASDETLFEATRARALAMRTHGVTAIEIKSGYGLSVEHEPRHLAVARRVGLQGDVLVTTSLLAAHAVPPERADDRTGYLDEIVHAILPEVAARGLADACDVYLDEGAFRRDEAERVLRAAAHLGLRTRAHVGQFADLGGAELCAELGALSADHLEQVSDAGLRAMAEAGVTAVLLPGAWRTLRQTPPDAGRMRAHGVRIAVGTDCNPGTSPSLDLPLMAALAVRDAGLTPEEAVLAITADAARAAGFADAGRIRIGGPADLAMFDADDPRALAYVLGGLEARLVTVAGRPVHRAALGPRVW
ncbi:MAG: imidazolonepropionase [Sandaracinaceae bacterium]